MWNALALRARRSTTESCIAKRWQRKDSRVKAPLKAATSMCLGWIQSRKAIAVVHDSVGERLALVRKAVDQVPDIRQGSV